MKLFTAIATAAVISASFLVPNPVEARNGWKSLGDNYYVKPAGCNGNICNANINVKGDHFIGQYNCKTWQYRVPSGDWRPIMPGSNGEAAANYVCR